MSRSDRIGFMTKSSNKSGKANDKEVIILTPIGVVGEYKTNEILQVIGCSHI